MKQASVPEVFEISAPEVRDIAGCGDGKRMAWLAALALMAILAGATLALLEDDTPSAGLRVSVVR